jgi:hypothetical protein
VVDGVEEHRGERQVDVEMGIRRYRSREEGDKQGKGRDRIRSNSG